MTTPSPPLLQITEEAPRKVPVRSAMEANLLLGWPLLRLGFRPFYLVATAFACTAVPLWMAVYLGAVRPPMALSPLLWHAHEMLMGFAAGVIVGFLLTAVKAWTGAQTPHRKLLGSLVLLWLAARLAAWFGPYAVFAVLDGLLLPVVAGLLMQVLLRSGNRRNLPLVGLLLLLATANVSFHLAVLGWWPVDPVRALYAALGVIVMVECVMAGRVIPGFTMSANPGLRLSTPPWLERGALALTAAGLGAWIFAPASAAAFALLASAAALQLARMLHWRPLAARSKPILWILHAAYAWIPLGLTLLALAQRGWIPVSLGVHALAVGATGGLIIGMVTRTARGHTGRPLVAGRAEVVAYGLVLAAATFRVLVPLAAPQWTVPALLAAAAAWSAAFLLYLSVYAPWLMRVRIDGRDG